MAQLSDDCFAAGGRTLATAEALALIDARVVPITETVTVGLRAAAGRILGADVVAERAVPPHDNAAVDGYAFAFADLGAGEESVFPIAGRAAAGRPYTGRVAAGSAVRIFTGAPMPSGLDTVVMQEDCRAEGERVAVRRGLKVAATRRKAGEDVKEGSTILAAGRRLRPQDVGLIASIGRSEILVHRALRAAVFSTGDEVVEPGAAAGPGAIYDANRFIIMALLEGLGCAVTDLGILRDDRAAIGVRLVEAAAANDIVVTSGGVSVGEEDHVKAAVEVAGSLHFWRLAIKPGRPIALGQIGAVPFVGLPGNPVAAMVTFLRFARPLILRLAGASDVTPALFRVRSGFDHKKKKNRREFLRARLDTAADGSLTARKFERQGAGILSSIVDSDGLVELPEELTELNAGDMVDFLPFAEVAA